MRSGDGIVIGTGACNGTDRPVCDPLSKNAWNSGHGIRTMRRELMGQHGVELRGLRAVGWGREGLDSNQCGGRGKSMGGR